jgi:hypothetical protein
VAPALICVEGHDVPLTFQPTYLAGMNEVAEQTFTEWLALQVHREDATGRLARDVASEEKRIGRPLVALNCRLDLVFYAQAAPKNLGLNKPDALAAWEEWLHSAVDQHFKSTSPR